MKTCKILEMFWGYACNIEKFVYNANTSECLQIITTFIFISYHYTKYLSQTKIWLHNFNK